MPVPGYSILVGIFFAGHTGPIGELDVAWGKGNASF